MHGSNKDELTTKGKGLKYNEKDCIKCRLKQKWPGRQLKMEGKQQEGKETETNKKTQFSK